MTRDRLVLRAPAAFLALAATAVLVASASAAAKTPPGKKGEREVRYQQLALAIGGHEVGTTRARDIETPEGYRFERESELSLVRGPARIDMKTRTVSRTTKSFEPLGFTFEKTDATGRFVIEGERKGKMFVVTTRGGGSETQRKIPLDGDLTLAGATELWVRENLGKKSELKRNVLVEEMGAVAPMTVRIKKRGKGWMVKVAIAGLESEDELDAAGNTILSRTPNLGAVAYPVGAPPPKDVQPGAIDMLARSTWKAPRLPGDVRVVRYRIHTPDAQGFTLPEDERQRVLQRTAGYLDVEVRNVSSTRGALPSKERARLTAETPYEPIRDPALKGAAARQVKGARTTREKVERLTQFVYEHVEAKGLDRGYQPALTTLETRTGDCTEHSVLLSALLRSQGIPTRLVDGIVVDGGRAGYHQWVEVQIDREGLVPTDPTFGQFPANPARLKLAQGSSAPEDLLALGVAAGRVLRPGVKIEVLSFE